MPIRSGRILWILSWSIFACTALHAQDSNGRWHLFGSNELSIDEYSVSGDESASPYQHEGTFVTDRLNLGLGYDDGRGRELQVQAEVLTADNDFLAEDGLVLAELSVDFQDGSRAVPYRIGAGDVYANFSRRTLQREIRGASVELQPDLGFGGHSFLFLAGTGEQEWEETFSGHADDLWFQGGSYLFATPGGATSVVANYVDVDRSEDPGRTPAPRSLASDHEVASLYVHSEVAGWTLEGEVAALEAERETEELDETSYYAQIARPHGAFSWRLRYEDNGEEFEPAGGVGILPDRTIAEAHLRYRLPHRGMLRGRFQAIERNVEGDDTAIDTDVAALTYRGRPFRGHPTFRVSLSGDLNEIEAEDGTTDQEHTSLRLGLQERSGGGWSAEYDATYRKTEDRIRPELDRESIAHSLTLGKRFASTLRDARVRFELRGGARYRDQENSGGYESWSPEIEASARSRHHRVALRWNFLDQDFALVTVEDLEYQTRRLRYSYHLRNHAVSLELGEELRRPEEERETDSLKATLRYRYSFDHWFGKDR